MKKQQGNWTDCRDGNLPKEDGFYLVSLSRKIHHGDDNLAVRKCWFNEKTKTFSEYGRFVVAWQPLPPKFEEDA